MEWSVLLLFEAGENYFSSMLEWSVTLIWLMKTSEIFSFTLIIKTDNQADVLD